MSSKKAQNKKFLCILTVVLLCLSKAAVAKNSDSMQAGGRIGLLHTCLGSQGWEVSWALGPSYRLGLSILQSNIGVENSVYDAMVEDTGSSSSAPSIVATQVLSAYMERTMLLVENRVFPFSGHSFNIGFGAGAARLKSDFRLIDPASQELIEEKISYQQMTAYLTIGNFWAWKHFYIAADWVGRGQVLAFKKDVEIKAANAMSETAAAGKNYFDESLVKAGEEGGGTILNFSFGVVF